MAVTVMSPVVVAATAPADTPSGSPAVVAPRPKVQALQTGRPCTQQAITSCLLPYPSSRYLDFDPTSATQYRVHVPDDILAPEILQQFGPGATPEEVYGGADGFSVLTPVIFELADEIDPTTLPLDGGHALAVIDLDTGATVKMRARVSPDAERLGARNKIIEAVPIDRFDYGHRYLAVINDSLRGVGGVALRPAPGLDPVDARSRIGRVRARRLQIQTDLLVPTVGSAHVLSSTTFVIRSQANATADVDRMAGIVRGDDHPIRNLWVNPSLIGGAELVTGEVQISDFRDPDGVIPKGEAIVSHPTWINFMMVMPLYPASAAGAPVAIYGHGISVSRETMLAVSSQNADRGIATVGIDIPNHGSRSYTDSGYLFELTKPSTFGRIASMTLQGELDQLSLFMAIKQHFGVVDTMPINNWLTSSWGDGRPDLDTHHVIYEGTSMGGFLGTEFVALTPELDGAFIQVGGTGIIDTIFHSFIWPLFEQVVPAGATAGDSHALLGAAGMMLDRSDNVNVLDRIAINGTPFFLVYARDDGIVPNASSERQIRLMGLPIVGETYMPTPGITRHVDTLPANGTGASQIPTFELDGNLLKALLTHTSFGSPRPTAELNAWLDQRLAAMGLSHSS